MTTGIGARQLVVTRAGSAFFGIDIEAVHEIIHVPVITALPRSERNLLGVINVRGTVVPVADIRACLGVDMSPLTEDARIVLVSYKGSKLGLVVDAVTEVTTLPDEAHLRVDGDRGESPFVRSVVRFEGSLVSEIDHARVIDERLNSAPAGTAPLFAQPGSGAIANDAVAGDAPVEELTSETQLLRNSLTSMVSSIDAVTDRFFARLADTAPGVRALFPPDTRDSRAPLRAALDAVVANAVAHGRGYPYADGIGTLQFAIDAMPAHVDLIAGCIVGAVADTYSSGWTEDLYNAWTDAFGALRLGAIESLAA